MQITDSFAKTLMPGKIEEGREGDDRGWDGWMASLTRWTWVWVSSGRRWRKGKPGKLQSMGCQRVGHEWATELNWTDITSWEIDGETVETVSDFILGGSKITADGDCSHKIKKKRFLLPRKVMTKLDSIFKSRDITLPTKICLVKAMVFPVVIYAC